MKKINIVLIILIIILTTQKISAQDFIPFGIVYEKTGKLKSDTKELETGRISANGKLPLLFSKTNYGLILQTEYINTKLKASNTIGSSNYNTGVVSLVWFQMLSNGFDYFALFQNRVSAESKLPFFKNSYTFNASAGIGKEFNKSFYAGLGGFYIYSYGKPLFFPVINVKYKYKSVMLNVEFPDFISVWYSINNDWKIGVINSYTANQFKSTINNKADYLRSLSNSIGIQSELILNDSYLISIYGGYMLNNSIESFTSNEILEKENYKNSINIKAGISYRISN